MGLFSTLFGSKPKPQESESGNKAWDFINTTYSPMAQGGTSAFNTASGLLSGSPESKGAFDNFLNNSGYSYLMDNAMQGLTNSAAGKYLLRSGPTLKAMQDRSVNLTKTMYQNYLQDLMGLSQQGLGAGALMTNAGQWSKGTGGTAGSQGLLGSALQMLPFIFSDPELKTDVEPVGVVGVYDYRYKDDPSGTRRRGFMADEIEAVHPEAMGPRVGGFRTINPRRLAGEL